MASALNRRDPWIWHTPGYCPLPVTLGSDGAGIVSAVGPGVEAVAPDDEVSIDPTLGWGVGETCPTDAFDILGAPTEGTFAERVVVPAANVASRPSRLSWEECAALNLSGLTAWRATMTCARARPGCDLLVTGAGGGVGLHAVQLARLAGAFVIAQTTSPGKADLIREMGAHQMVVHKRGEDFSPEVKRLTDGRGVDVLIDNVGTVLFEPMRRSLGTAGRWVLIGQLTGDFVPFNPAQLFLKNQSMLAVTSVTRNQLEDVLAIIGRGEVKPVVTKSLPLEQAAEAHTLVESGRGTGRILLRPNA
jgi:NADPH:quinone reductase-like Zn-dependent oxidoreductase